MSKRTLRKNLSIVVEPSHRLIIDDTDNNNGRLTGRVILSNEPEPVAEHPAPARSTSVLAVPPSPAPSSFAFTPELSVGSSSTGESALPSIASGVSSTFPPPPVRQPSARNLKHLSLNLPASSSSMQSSPADLSLPPSPLPPAQSSFQLSSTSDHQLTSSPLPLPSTTLAERRRRSSSAASLPAIPAPLRPRTDSTANPTGNNPSTLSSRPPSIRSTISRGGRAEEDGYGYTSSHPPANNNGNATTVGLAAPEPYLNGPIQILPGVWLGCEDNARDFASLKRCGIGYVLNVAKEITNIFGGEEDRKSKPSLRPLPLGKLRSSSTSSINPSVPSTPLPHVGTSTRTFHPADPTTGRPDIHYMHLAWSHGQSDLVTSGFPAAMAFADEAIKKGKGVLVHCQCGVSRSATLVIALVMRAAQNSDAVDELKALKGSMHAAYAYVKEKSVAIGPNMSLIYQLLEYERHLTRKHADQHADDLSATPGEDASTRSEEEEWGRMRKLMEEEEERERQERERGLQSAVDDSSDHLALHQQHQHQHHLHQAQQQGDIPQHSNSIPVINVPTYGTAPWAAGGSSNAWTNAWNGYTLSNTSSGHAGGASTRTGSISGASIVSGPADDEEARDLDRQMEERMEVRRKGSATSFTSSVVSASAASSASGGNPGAAGSGIIPWKSRLNHRPQRLRAGSIESNYTGHSMVSLEEEEEEEEMKQQIESPESMNIQLPSLDAVDGPSMFRERTVSASTRSSASISALTVDEEDRDSEPFTSPPLDPETDAGSKQRAFLPPATFPNAQPLSLPPKRHRKRLSLDGSIPELGVADSTPKTNPGPTSLKLSAAPKAFSSRVELSQSKPGFRPLGQSMSVDLAPLSPLSKPPAFRSLSTNGLAFASSSSVAQSAAPPPSAPATKLSFGLPELTVPFPRRQPSGSSLHSGRSASGSLNGSSLSYTRPESTIKVKVSKKHLPELAVVPCSPVQPTTNTPAATTNNGVDQSLNSPMVHIFRQDEKPQVAPPVEQSLPKPSGSVKPLTSMLNAASRKRSASTSIPRPAPETIDVKKRPAPLPIQPSQDRKSGEHPGLSYILSSSSRRRAHHRSSSSVSSLSSTSSRSSSQSSLRNKILGRFMGGRSSSPPPGPMSSSTPLTATPHQTLFIFPPSPTSNTTGKSGSQAPSTLTVTTTTGAASNPSSSYFPLLTPTPTLSSFRMSRAPSFSGRGSLPTNSSFPASTSSVSTAQGGWMMGSAQINPTTACSRVDVRGWVGI